MTTQVDPNGFEDLRTYVQSNWQHVALVDDTGTEVLRIDVVNDAAGSFISGPADNPVTAEVNLNGQDLIDAGVSLPATIASVEAFKSSTATSRVAHDSVTNATVEANNDQVSVRLDYNLPP